MKNKRSTPRLKVTQKVCEKVCNLHKECIEGKVDGMHDPIGYKARSIADIVGCSATTVRNIVIAWYHLNGSMDWMKVFNKYKENTRTKKLDEPNVKQSSNSNTAEKIQKEEKMRITMPDKVVNMKMPPSEKILLSHVLTYQDNDIPFDLTNAEIGAILNVGKRQSCNIVTSLLEKGLLVSEINYRPGTMQIHNRVLNVASNTDRVTFQESSNTIETKDPDTNAFRITTLSEAIHEYQSNQLLIKEDDYEEF